MSGKFQVFEDRRSMPAHWIVFITIVVFVGMAVPAVGSDRHSGYYYPEPQSGESYKGRAPMFKDAGKRSRVALVTGLSNRLFSSPAAPNIAIFAKGAEAEKLIIVALRDGEFNTLFRIRALLAMLTAEARATPIFARAAHPEELTFLDFLSSLGFKRLTVTDGVALSHRYDLN